MKKFDLKKDSLSIGKSIHYFAVMKKKNSILFRFCSFYSKASLVEGYTKLTNYYLALKIDVQEICYAFEQPYDFSKWLFENDIYASIRAGYSINFVFNQTDMVRIDCIYKLKKIKKAWDKQND